MASKKKLLVYIFRPNQQNGQIHDIGPCGAGTQQGAAVMQDRVAVVFFQSTARLLQPRNGQVAGPGTASGGIRGPIRTIRTGEQGADMRAVLQGQAGRQRHFLIASPPAPAAKRHGCLASGQQADRLCVRGQLRRHLPGLCHQQGRLLPGFSHHPVRQDDRTKAVRSGLLRRCVKGLPVGGDQRVLHMPEQGISAS